MEQLILTLKSQLEWERWLSKNYSQIEGVWVRFYKKSSGLQTFNYDEALDEALCYGWIDGQTKSFDERSYLQKFTPRRKRSPWSQINKGHIDRLTKVGKMKPSGISEVERAKDDGRWESAYASPKNTTIPKDFETAILKDKKSKESWEKLNKTNRFAMIFQINNAKKEETRTRRIEKFIEMLKRGEKLY